MLPGVKLQSVGICVKRDQPQVAERVITLEEWLHDHGSEVLLDREAARWLGRRGLELDDLAARVDLLIVLGGDGTLLSAARDRRARGAAPGREPGHARLSRRDIERRALQRA